MRQHKILYLAANPVGLTERALEARAREIRMELQLGTEPELLDFVARLAVQPRDILRELRSIAPSIVHFVGHPECDGIYVRGDNGQPVELTSDALRATFESIAPTVELVVLDGCATPKLAAALCSVVPVCVGTSRPISDVAARAFNIGLYGALASNASVAQARTAGRAAILLEGAGDHIPQLWHRQGLNPREFALGGRAAAATTAGAELEARPELSTAERALVIDHYRQRKGGSFANWDLEAAGPMPVTGHHPAEITLDEMYIPLRFDAEVDPSEPDRGAAIGPDELLAARTPQVVIGAAGSGKTTWMRWSFRRLIHDQRAIPFFLELRTIGSRWTTPQDAGRSIESYLVDELSHDAGERVASAVIAAMLADPAGPRPVVLLDGWDELGSQGARLRERLVELHRTAPHVVIVVSSRPYGETRPSSAQAFTTRYIQPLSDGEVRLLADRFHGRIHRGGDAAAGRATREFMAALGAAPEARSLAGTVLLLTMMLLLSREGPLPDRRHRLYNACLRSMLQHRPALRERDGVKVDVDRQWRPADSEERLRAVAELAYRMQVDGYRTVPRSALARARSDALDVLGTEWDRDRRERFLCWLVVSTGVLVERSDGSIQFAHLSFQEHLAAHHLSSSHEGDERVSVFRSHMADRRWWETLRLAAGLTADSWPGKLGAVLEALRADPHGYWLAGQMFADGTGRWSDFAVWVAELPARLSDPFATAEDCAAAWGMCKQDERRDHIARALIAARDNVRWLPAAWHARWGELARLAVDPAPVLQALGAPVATASAVARSRVLHGMTSSWPDASDLALLRLWPSTRATVGVRLQGAISLGATRDQLVELLRVLVARAARPWSSPDDDRARHVAATLRDGLSSELIRCFFWSWKWSYARHPRSRRSFPLDLTHDLLRCLVHEFPRDFVDGFAASVARFFRQFSRVRRDGPLTRHSDLVFIQDLARHLQRGAVRELGRCYGEDLGLRDPLLSASWLSTYAVLEAGSVAGRASVRAVLAHEHVRDEAPRLALFRAACQASLAPDDPSLRLAAARACDGFEDDGLWPALARQVARISTSEDRTLLEVLAQHPEYRDPPLSWGLQHYVRADVTLDDDTVVTLDELCDEAGLAPLSFLDDMPDELDVLTSDEVGKLRS